MSDRVFIDLDTIMDRIRAKIVSRGAVGIRGLGRLFRIADDNGNGMIDLHTELPKLLGDIGVLLNKTEIAELGRMLDRNGDGNISYDEFLYYFAPKMSEARQKAVDEVYEKLDADGSGSINIDDVVSRNPALKSDSASAVMQNLINVYDKDNDHNISKDEFSAYYRELSPNFNTDEQFIETLKNSWGL